MYQYKLNKRPMGNIAHVKNIIPTTNVSKAIIIKHIMLNLFTYWPFVFINLNPLSLRVH